MPRLASISQPKGQELHWTQLPALREIGPPEAPERLRALHRQLAVAAHPLGVERRAPGGTPRPRRSRGRGRVAQPMPCSVAPAVEHLVGGAEAGARVDHRRPADVFADRDRDRRAALGDGQAGVAVEGRDRVERARRGSCRGCSGRRPRARSRRARPRPASRPPTAPPAPEPTITTSHSSPRRWGARVAERARRLGGSVPSASAAADLDRRSAPRPRGGVRSRASRRPSPAAAARGGGGSASPPCWRRKSSRASRVEAAEAPREGQPLEGAQAEPDPAQDRCGETRGEELGDRAGDVDVALGRGQAVEARAHRLAERAQGALLGGREPRRAPSAGRRAGGRCGRSATRARARRATREPSTRKLSR